MNDYIVGDKEQIKFLTEDGQLVEKNSTTKIFNTRLAAIGAAVLASEKYKKYLEVYEERK